jgi:hypothetical protein
MAGTQPQNIDCYLFRSGNFRKNLKLSLLLVSLIFLLNFDTNCQTKIFGEIHYFNKDTIDKEFKLVFSFCDTDYVIKEVKSKAFTFNTKCSGLNDLKIVIFSSNTINYYPIILKDVNIRGDSIYIGFVPMLLDTFGYFTEWGSYSKIGLFKRKVHYYSTTVSNLPQRLLFEKNFSDIYRSCTQKSDTIFRNITVNSVTTKRMITFQETRFITITFRDLVHMSECQKLESK